jgi:hypothetical protein
MSEVRRRAGAAAGLDEQGVDTERTSGLGRYRLANNGCQESLGVPVIPPERVGGSG